MTALDHLGWVVTKSYSVGEMVFAVRSTSQPFGVWLDDALAAYRADGAVAPRYSIVIADEGDGMRAKERYHILYRGTQALIKTPAVETLVHALFNDMEGLLTQERDDALYADMVPVSRAGVTALVPSQLVPFLGTLGRRRLAKTGLTLPIETWTAFEPDTGDVGPLFPILDARGGSPDALAGVLLVEGADDRGRLDGTHSADVLISIGWGEETIQPVSKALALYRLGSHVTNLWKFGQRGLDGLKRVAEGARCYEMGAKKPGEMLDGLLAALTPA